MKSTNQNILNLEDLKLVGKIFTKNWHLFIIIPFILGLFTYIYAHRLTDIYQAKIQLILKSSDTDLSNPFKDYYSSYEETSNQIMVIKSSNILEEVIERLHLNVSYFIVGRLKTTEIYQDMPFRVSSDNFGQNAFGIPFYFKIKDEKSYLLEYTYNDQKVEKEYQFGELIAEHDLFFRIEKNKNLSLADNYFEYFAGKVA